jgi:hypothetical protein
MRCGSDAIEGRSGERGKPGNADESDRGAKNLLTHSGLYGLLVSNILDDNFQHSEFQMPVGNCVDGKRERHAGPQLAGNVSFGAKQRWSATGGSGLRR